MAPVDFFEFLFTREGIEDTSGLFGFDGGIFEPEGDAGGDIADRGEVDRVEIGDRAVDFGVHLVA